MIQAKILGFVLEHLFAKSKRMKKILDYFNKPNKNDKAIDEIKKEIAELKKNKADKNRVA